MGLLASRLFRLTAESDDPQAPAPQPLFQPAFAAPSPDVRQSSLAEYRLWLTRLFGGPILVRLDEAGAHRPRLLIRYQRTHDCVLPDDRERLVRDNPRALSAEILDEAAEYLWALWKAENRPSLFEVMA